MGKFIDLTGLKIGKLLVIKRVLNEYTYRNSKIVTRVRYNCLCECGKKIIRFASDLRKKQRSTCGQKVCKWRYKNLLNQTFGRWTVIKDIKKIDAHGTHLWKCQCICGKQKIIPADSLCSGNSKSCGCYAREMSSIRHKNRIVTNQLPKGSASFNDLFARYKKSSIQRNLIFNLNTEEFKFLTSSNCYYCNIEPKQAIRCSKNRKRNGDYLYNGIDRKNPKIGYIIENCVSCCSTCNYAKQSLTYEDFTNHIQKIYHNILKHV